MHANYDQDNIFGGHTVPYPAGHREQVRKRILESARRLFNKYGFQGVSVDAIMAGAGLTRGGFYSYFANKSELYVEAMGCFFTDPNWKSRWEGVQVDLAAADAGPQIVRAYLSLRHLEDVENSCPMVALPCDVARSDDRVKEAFENVFKAMAALLKKDIRNRAFAAEDSALAISALCVGGMVVARALNDRNLSDSLLAATSRIAFALGGWKPTPTWPRKTASTNIVRKRRPKV
jgi:AcrR family transcriptional regulator